MLHPTIGFSLAHRLLVLPNVTSRLASTATRLEQPAEFNQKRTGAGGKHGNKERTTPYGWLMLSIPLTTFGLGCWQVQRKQWKEDLVRELEIQTSKPPVPFPQEYAKYFTRLNIWPNEH